MQKKIQQKQLDANISLGGGGGSPQVVSFNTRTGAVLPAAGDYAASEITNDSTVSGVNVDDALDQTVTLSGTQTISGLKVLSTELRIANGNASSPAINFASDQDCGMYRISTNRWSLASNADPRLIITPPGEALGVSTPGGLYETLVLADDDIPNKKYVDDEIVAAGGGSHPTENTFGSTFRSFGSRSISGLTIGKKYLVSVVGFSACRGNGNASNRGIVVRDGIDITTGTVLYNQGLTTINWPDGNAPQSGSVIVTALSADIVMSIDWFNSAGALPPSCAGNSNGSIRQASAVQLD